MYRYYMTERGFSPGAQPMKNLIDHGDYNGRIEVAAYELVSVDPLPFN